MSFKYLILDLDETLYSKRCGLVECIDGQIEDFIRQKLQLSVEETKMMRRDYYHKYGTTLSGMIVNYGISPVEYIQQVFQINLEDYIKPDPKLASILTEINLKKVVFSNSPLEYVEKVLKILGIYNQFHKIYDIQFNNFMGKPNLDSFCKVLEDLNTSGSNCIMVDDSLVNVLMAKKLGMATIWLSENQNLEINCVIKNIYELRRVISGLLQPSISA
jgi:putative hydrolase of the HAD superfamily